MPLKRALLFAIALLAFSASAAAADHGYWPAGNVTPAKVTGHRPADEAMANPAFWGTGCRPLGTDTQWDNYGAVLDADYRLAVVLGADSDATLFEDAKAGEFLWADADGDGQFANAHEADTGLVIVCSSGGLPATDTADRDPRGVRSPETALAWMAASSGVVVVLLAFGRLARTNRRT